MQEVIPVNTDRPQPAQEKAQGCGLLYHSMKAADGKGLTERFTMLYTYYNRYNERW